MENDVKMIRFIGFHGTDERNVESIQQNNFQESTGDSHWLGEAVYFFTSGVGDGVAHARNWAKSDAYERKYTRYAIIKADIAVNDDAILDLRLSDGLELFNLHRSYILTQLRRKKKEFRPNNEKYSDGKVIEHMKQVAGIEVVVGNQYVQFGIDRREKIFSRVPNCTFLCVSNPKDNVNPAVTIVERGNI